MADEHYCISCGAVDEGPLAKCHCMDEGPLCAVCGEPEYVPLTPWKSNYHDDSDHEFELTADA